VKACFPSKDNFCDQWDICRTLSSDPNKAHSSAADRVILDYQPPASSPVAARRAGSVILTAQPAAGGGAGWRRREPGQDDTDATGVLDPDARPEMDTSPGQPTARTRQAAMPGNATAELTAAAQTARGAGGSGCPRRPPLSWHHAERRAS
jgi:hypothetical protein